MGDCGWLWMVVGGCGWLWVVLGGCELLWVVVDRCGWLWVVEYFNITRLNLTVYLLIYH